MNRVTRLFGCVGLFFCTGLCGVDLELPYPKDIEISKKEDRIIALRDGDDDTKTESTSCSITSVPFDELFDEVGTDTIVVAAVITEVNKKFVVHYFDASALIDYFLSLLPVKFDLLTTQSGGYILKGYKYLDYVLIPESHGKTTILLKDDRLGLEILPNQILSDHMQREMKRLLTNPANKQEIFSVQFFEIQRTQNITEKKKIYLYKAHYMGSLKDIVQDAKELLNFNTILFKNVPLKERERAVTKLAISLLNQGEREKALYLFEGIKSQSPLALKEAARIRLGYMSKASKEEQLKGLEYYQELIKKAVDNNEKLPAVQLSIALVELLYWRAENEADYKNILPYVRILDELKKEENSSLWLQGNLLLGKIYLKLKDYEKAQKYLSLVEGSEIDSINAIQKKMLKAEALLYLSRVYLMRSQVKIIKFSDYSSVLSMLNKAIDLLGTATPLIKYRIFNDIGQMSELYTRHAWGKKGKTDHLEGFDKMVTQSIHFLGEADKGFTTYLASQQSKQDNDFQRKQIEQSLVDVKKIMAQVMDLKKKIQEQKDKNMLIISESKKHGSDDKEDSAPKRVKK